MRILHKIPDFPEQPLQVLELILVGVIEAGPRVVLLELLQGQDVTGRQLLRQVIHEISEQSLMAFLSQLVADVCIEVYVLQGVLFVLGERLCEY